MQTGADAAMRLPAFRPHLVILHAASLRTSGKRIYQSLRALAGSLPIIMITSTSPAIQDEDKYLVTLTLPFTIRKLMNRLRPFLPSESDHQTLNSRMLQSGQVCLDPDRKLVRVEGRETHLTPRLAQLLAILLKHPGEVVERELLFREGWNTGYTGDTRTLDVHISWLRQAIEEDPRNPRYLKTIRGVGYRLDTQP